MTAFVSSFLIPSRLHLQLAPTSNCTTRMTLTSRPSPAPHPSIHNRSVVTWRGLSDLGGLTVLHELGDRYLLPTTAASSMLADSQLLLGGLMAVWTAALFAERTRFETDSLIRESAQLPQRWDSSIIYTPTLDENDVADVVAWLYAFEELDGIAAVDLLCSIATSGSPTMRLRLAEALAAYPVPSNIFASVLADLQKDHHPLVRDAAHTALDSIRVLLTVLETSRHDVAMPPREVDTEEQQIRLVLDSLFSMSLDSSSPSNLTTDTPSAGHAFLKSRLKTLVSERFECMRNAALSNPDLRQLQSTYLVPESQSNDIVESSEVPLFDGLKWSEIHGLCTLALLPVGYELLASVVGLDLPLRYVGLGWLLTFGGLIAYPQSAGLWHKLRKSLDDKNVSKRSD